MKLKELEKAAAKAQQDFRVAEVEALDAKRIARLVKAKAQQSKLEHKRARKAARQAKQLARGAAAQAEERYRFLQKAERRFAKALSKIRQGESTGKQKPVRAAAVPPRRAPVKAPQPAVAASKHRAKPIKAERPMGNGHPPRSAVQEVTGASPGPAV